MVASLGGFAFGIEDLSVSPDDLIEVLPLAVEAFQIQERAMVREARHAAELAKKGIAEVPPCDAQKYRLDVGISGAFSFDDFGELYIDRRFVTESEMVTVHAIERWFRKCLGRSTREKKPAASRIVAGRASGVPVFRGFEDDRYQVHDALIVKMVADFNAHKAQWCGGSSEQAAKIGDLTPAMVKSHMIEESGGNGASSRQAWAVDPLQVNVPGDWGAEKELVGLAKPAKRNEGTLENNVRAAIMYLSRKGFSSSGRPAAERPKGYFDGWPDAYRRYNGRRDRTATDRYYSEEYADKVMKRATDPDLFVPVEIKVASSSKKENG